MSIIKRMELRDGEKVMSVTPLDVGGGKIEQRLLAITDQGSAFLIRVDLQGGFIWFGDGGGEG